MELNYERMGKIIKAVRIARGLSQADLAESIAYQSRTSVILKQAEVKQALKQS